MSMVLDASMALSWLFERITPVEIDRSIRAAREMCRTEAIVPLLWHAEIANALLVAERRKIVSEARVIDYLEHLAALLIAEDSLPPAVQRDKVMALARLHGLSAYDATYLELALRKNASLATFDGRLAQAMRDAGGRVFD
jgi:predicted nucleic acid-binding protein